MTMAWPCPPGTRIAGDEFRRKPSDEDGKTPLIWQERLCAPQG
jgi:hypothetical protein